MNIFFKGRSSKKDKGEEKITWSKSYANGWRITSFILIIISAFFFIKEINAWLIIAAWGVIWLLSTEIFARGIIEPKGALSVKSFIQEIENGKSPTKLLPEINKFIDFYSLELPITMKEKLKTIKG